MSNLLALPVDAHAIFRALARNAENEMAYSALCGAEQIFDISAEAGCEMLPGYRLIRVNERGGICEDAFELALINDIEPSVVYYNKVTVTDLYERQTTRSLVWRSASAQHAAALQDVAHHVLFNYITDRYDVILSDSEQTGESKFFWQRQMSKAIAYGLYVYFQVAPAQFQPITTQVALSELGNELWSAARGEQRHIGLITKDMLPASLLV